LVILISGWLTINIMSAFTLPFRQIGMKDLAKVGGKNASLGEMYCHLSAKGVAIPNGFATTAGAWQAFIAANQLQNPLEKLFDDLDTKDFSNLAEIGRKARDLILGGKLPEEVQKAILAAYQELDPEMTLSVAVRSSATAEDLPTASFAGQLESYLNIRGPELLLHTCLRCFASLYTNRAIKYREDQGFGQTDVVVSVGVQQMVNAGTGCAGVAFSLDPDTGFDKVVVINGNWGLGENVVKGAVNPDEFVVFKPALRRGFPSILARRIGKKQQTMVYRQAEPGAFFQDPAEPTLNLDTPEAKRKQAVLTNEEVCDLARWILIIEDHYGKPMDIEWAKDGSSGKLFIVQARPETVHSTKQDAGILQSFKLVKKGKLLTTGIGLGNKIAAGKARILQSPEQGASLKPGEVLVTGITNPDWDPIMKKAAAIVTDKGGRTSHAAIVARELGVVAIVGTGDGTQVIEDGQMITVSCAEGKTGRVYEGMLDWKVETLDVGSIKMPETTPMLILGDPERAFALSRLPHRGIGLMRLEFVIGNSIAIHPMALVRYDELEDETVKSQIDALSSSYANKSDYFVDKLSQAVGTIAAAFWPEEVIVRMSDFKSNEYANLIGGKLFEPEEENPMIGFRGASRYYHPLYREGFRLECEAMRVVRDEMGLTNVKLMIPFCRTVEEGRKVLDTMADFGLKQGKNGLEVYVMIEIPSNVLLAEEFAEIFDGFSIGSNDLTQFTLGIDRDSELISNLFDEKNAAVKKMIASVIATARQTGTRIGLCGQAPSDFPEFAAFLVENGIDSISFTPDSLITGIDNILIAEEKMLGKMPV
jgi:pyruvate,water dikinase